MSDDNLSDNELVVACAHDCSSVVVNGNGLVGGGQNSFMSCRMTGPCVSR